MRLWDALVPPLVQWRLAGELLAGQNIFSDHPKIFNWPPAGRGRGPHTGHGLHGPRGRQGAQHRQGGSRVTYLQSRVLTCPVLTGGPEPHVLRQGGPQRVRRPHPRPGLLCPRCGGFARVFIRLWRMLKHFEGIIKILVQAAKFAGLCWISMYYSCRQIVNILFIYNPFWTITTVCIGETICSAGPYEDKFSQSAKHISPRYISAR